MSLLDWVKKHVSITQKSLDAFVIQKSDPLYSEHLVINALLAEYEQECSTTDCWYSCEADTYEVAKVILGSAREQQARFVAAMVQRLFELDRRAASFKSKSEICVTDKKWAAIWGPRKILADTIQLMLRRKLPLTSETQIALLRWCGETSRFYPMYYPLSATVSAAEEFIKTEGLTREFQELAAAFVTKLEACYHQTKAVRDGIDRLKVLLGQAPKLPIFSGEAWSDAAISDLLALDETSRAAWCQLLTHCRTADGAAPSKKWLKQANLLLKALDPATFRMFVVKWFELTEKRPSGLAVTPEIPESLLISEPHMDLLRGLAWVCGLSHEPEVARTLTVLALSAYRKVPGKGPRAVRVGNACITALGMIPGIEGVGQLALLKVRVKSGTAQAALEKALIVSAERAGVPREELEEMAVPAYGLTEVGRRIEPIGEFCAELSIEGSRNVNLTWWRADGKQPQKTLPAALKKEFAEDLKELSTAKRDLEQMLVAQAARLDSLFLKQKTWPLLRWQERYLEHPLVGTLARRLIWNFTTAETTTPGIWLDGKIVDLQGNPLTFVADATSVSLWHPLSQSVDVVLGWRAFLEYRQIQQPFKQAHREVYLLTPAEEATRVYSNRFAAHILKQHQFNALCASRGWKNKLRLMVDDSCPPAFLLLPKWGLRAEFWIEGVGDEYGTDTNEAGTFLYLSTDQVRFYREGAPQLSAHACGGGYTAGWHSPSTEEPLSLAEIPPLVLSEVMRDVDLFVGVASVSNDPNWLDGGRRDTEQSYWRNHSFGELSVTAQTRKAILLRLVPKLKIANRCSFSDKFLVVQGELRTYKIHLGSSNILMSPNDQYLCIVPGRSQTAQGDKIFLPFEGDQLLSLILSKAFLLAADSQITDRSITHQIGMSKQQI